MSAAIYKFVKEDKFATEDKLVYCRSQVKSTVENKYAANDKSAAKDKFAKEDKFATENKLVYCIGQIRLLQIY